MGLIIQGVKGPHTFNLEAFTGKSKSMTKTKFAKKYKNRLVNVEDAWEKIQAEIKRLKAL